MNDRPDPTPDDAGDDALGALIRRHATRHRASAALQSGVRAEIALLAAARTPAAGAPVASGAGTAEPRRLRDAFAASWRWLAGGAAAGALVTAALMALVVLPSLRAPDDGLAGEVVASHVRSLMLSHLSDVISTDQHTVKPWFQGKLAYAPPVEDFVPDGFPLAGGRLDYIAGQPVAALVYHRRGHVINLFVWPAGSGSSTTAANAAATQRGFHVVHWQGGGMTFWAVSDVAMDDLEAFAHLWQQRLPTAAR